MWQHTCSLESPEFKDTLLIARAKKGTERTPEEHTIISHALKHKAACPPAVRQEPDNTLNLLDIDFWLRYRKVTPKGMACAFKI